jgi:hypothetical protein
VTIASSFKDDPLAWACVSTLVMEGLRRSHFVSGKKNMIHTMVKADMAVQTHQKLCQP